MLGRYQAYPEYKDAESKWLDMLPTSWERAPLKYLVAIRITDGPHETPDFVDDGVPFLSAEAVKNNKLDFSKKRGYITKALHELYSKKCLPQLDDVFMIKSGNTTGNIAMVETSEEFNIWSPLALIRANRLKVLPRFVFYAMRADYFRTSVELSWSQGTQPNIGMAVIENLHIAFGSLEEQKSIANFLDNETAKIDTLIEKQQQLIQLLKEKRQAVISHAVTKGLNPNAPMKDSGVEWLGEVPEHWVVCAIKYVLASQNSRRIPLSSEERGMRSGDFRYYGASGVIDYIDDYIFDDESNVLVGEDGANLVSRNTPLAFGAHGQYWVNNHAHILKPRDSLADYWAEVIEHIDVTPIVTGSAQPKLTAEALNNLIIAFPKALDERVAIDQFIKLQKSKYQNLIEKAQQQITLMQERRTALISAAVTGKIDVRNWQAPQI